MEKLEFKQDKYRKNRGGYSRFLEIKCESCNGFIALYQKDGPGALKRMYIDRIFSPQNLVNLQKVSFKKIPNLVCPHCKHIIGIPYIFKKEKRPAFRLFVGVIIKKIIKLK
jgi:phage FluMu protein Com